MTFILTKNYLNPLLSVISRIIYTTLPGFYLDNDNVIH